MKFLIAKYPKETTTEDVASLREEIKNAVKEAEESINELGVALVREDVSIGVLYVEDEDEIEEDEDDEDDEDDE